MAKQFVSAQVLCLLCCFAKLITISALTAAGKPECFQRENGALRSKTLMGRELIPAKTVCHAPDNKLKMNKIFKGLFNS